MVGRPRQFDEGEVLQRAMSVFWSNGYEATSMADLVAATGLHKGSIYQAFGNKHALFVTALTRYLEDMRIQKNELLAAAESPLDGIRAVLHGMLDIADSDDECPKGCMAINALVELAPHDPGVMAVMEDHLDRMRQSMIDVVTRAQMAEQVSRDRPPELITMMLITFMAGLATEIKGPMTMAQAHELLDAQLAAIL